MELADFDLCPLCELPSFSHETVVMISGEFYHRHCFAGTKQVVKRDFFASRLHWTT